MLTRHSQTYAMQVLRNEAVGEAGLGPARTDSHKRQTLPLPVWMRKEIQAAQRAQ